MQSPKLHVRQAEALRVQGCACLLPVWCGPVTSPSAIDARRAVMKPICPGTPKEPSLLLSLCVFKRPGSMWGVAEVQCGPAAASRACSARLPLRNSTTATRSGFPLPVPRWSPQLQGASAPLAGTDTDTRQFGQARWWGRSCTGKVVVAVSAGHGREALLTRGIGERRVSVRLCLRG